MELTAILMTALNAVLPIILMILLGYILNQKGFLSQNFLSVGNKLVFKLMLPSMLFINIYRLDTLSDIQWDVTLYALIAIWVIFALSLISAILTTPVPQRRGVILQCCFRRCGGGGRGSCPFCRIHSAIQCAGGYFPYGVCG